MSARLRIVSANLANRHAHPGAFADLVAALEPDAVAVQELWPDQAEALTAVLPHGRLWPRRDFDGMGIALRTPGTVRALPLRYRSALLVELPGREGVGPAVELLNVHILAPHAWPPGSAVGHRRGQVAGLVAHLEATRRPRVLVGDLNATRLFPAYRRLRGRLEDAALAAARGRGRRPAATWTPWPGRRPLLRIDHALVEGVTVVDVQVCPIPGSDHSALVVDLVAHPPAEGATRVARSGAGADPGGARSRAVSPGPPDREGSRSLSRAGAGRDGPGGRPPAG